MAKKILIGVAVAAVVLLAGTAVLVAGFTLGRGSTLLQAPLLALRGAAGDAYGPGTDETQPFGGMLRGWGRQRAGSSDRDGTADGPFGRRMPGGMNQLPGPWAGMHGFGLQGSTSAEPLTVAEAQAAVETFIKDSGLDNLAVGEVMVFDNHAYVVIEDAATGQGAFEVLVDPVRQVVHLEFGPSMMWNTTYGMHGAAPLFERGMMGGRMTQAPAPWAGAGGRGDFGPETITTDATPLTEAEAREKALAYLQQTYPDQTLSATAEAFPGYFTFDVEIDSQPVSMLSVNAYTGQVWYHTWHGAFVEMSE
jgi:hypothetical protein